MSRPALPVPLPLCRHDGHTCAACCWGEDVRRFGLVAQLRRQTRLFRPLERGRQPPGRWPLLRYELAARRGLDVVLALLLMVPFLADWLRPRLKRRMVCAFVGFEDAGERRVGCLLHPSRWGGRDVRARAAFALLPGFACGSPDYYCLAAHWFAAAGWQERKQWSERTAGLDWFQFSRAAAAYRPGKWGRVEGGG